MVEKLTNEMVWNVVKTIPTGKVLTYGDIAQILKKPRASRFVGWALHANNSSNVPCHRVVDRTGRVAPNFAFDGWREQVRRLKSEGVGFVDEIHVDMDKHLWKDFKN